MSARVPYGVRRGSGWLVAALGLALVLAATAGAQAPLAAANDNRIPAGPLAGGVLNAHLEVVPARWHPKADDGRSRGGDPATPATIDTSAFAEVGHAPQIPGPLLRVPRGATVRVSVHNRLNVAIFIHGFDRPAGATPTAMHLAPGETKQAEFVAGEPGSYLYWASTVAGGFEDRPGKDGALAGGLIVDAASPAPPDRVFIIQLWDDHALQPSFRMALTINGKSWPYTERLHARLGEADHWRILNASPLPHPMHLHGFFFTVNAVGDGQHEQRYSQAERRLVVTESVMPGHSFDMSWVPTRVGNWLFHCHIVDHMSTWVPPVLEGATAPAQPLPTRASASAHAAAPMAMAMAHGMARLVLGITVTGDDPPSARTTPVAAAVPRHLFVRPRPAGFYVPAGAGFYLEGVSRKTGAVGPPLVLTRGVRYAITITNQLTEPTAVHWHGLEIESYYDGVPGWDGTPRHTTPAIAPGQSFVAYLTPPRAGTFIYHTHWHDIAQLTGGLYGALLVLPPGQPYDPATDRVFLLGRGGEDVMHAPLVVNGSPQPDMLVLLAGQRYRFRFINITTTDEPITASLTAAGKPESWRALAKDGADLPPQQAITGAATAAVSVGSTSDFAFVPASPGLYELRFATHGIGGLGAGEVTVTILAVPRDSPLSRLARTD